MTRIEKDKWYICHTQFGLCDVGFKVKYTDYINRNGLRFVDENGMYYSITFDEIEKYFKPIEVKENNIKKNNMTQEEKANAPEKIYLIRNISTSTSLNTTNDCHEKYLQEWYKGREKDSDIEYTRTDAFIDKAWNWIEDNILSSNQQDKSLLYYEQFKKFIKGE